MQLCWGWFDGYATDTEDLTTEISKPRHNWLDQNFKLVCNWNDAQHYLIDSYLCENLQWNFILSVWWNHVQIINSVVLYKHFPCLAVNVFLVEKSNFVLLIRLETRKKVLVFKTGILCFVAGLGTLRQRQENNLFSWYSLYSLYSL